MEKNEYGFTLVEILVAVVILGILVVTFSSVFGSSVRSIWGAGNHHDALLEAQSLLEQVLSGSQLADARVSVHGTINKLNGQEGVLYTVRVPWQTGSGAEREVKLSAFKVTP